MYLEFQITGEVIHSLYRCMTHGDYMLTDQFGWKYEHDIIHPTMTHIILNKLSLFEQQMLGVRHISIFVRSAS